MIVAHKIMIFLLLLIILILIIIYRQQENAGSISGGNNYNTEAIQNIESVYSESLNGTATFNNV